MPQRRSSTNERRVTARNMTADERSFVQRNAAKLSPSTLRAKWTHEPGEHEDRPGQTLATRSPDVIRAWAGARRAKPATVARREGQRPRTLRLDFPGYGGRRLEPVDWDAWLRTFKERDLVFLYQEHRRSGEDSNFFRLDSPKREEG
jgi:hypothetical protein